MLQEAYIVAGSRTAIGKAKKGGFRFTTPVDLAYYAITDLLSKVPQFDPKRVDDVIVGNAVPEAEQGLQMGRWVALRSLPMEVSGVTVNRYCGSGVETIAMATAKIRSGMADVIIAGGTESMSLVPTVGYKTVPNFTIANEHPDYYIGMGLTAENIADKYGITREQSDEFSFNSHQKALAALAAGKFKQFITPVEVEEVYYEGGKKKSRKYIVDTDEGPRKDTTMEGLAKLKPVFKAGGQVTAGNSSQTSDAAAFVLVVSEKVVKELNLTPIARLVTSVTAGVDPRYMGMGPAVAIPKALERAGLNMGDLGLMELNEAFAAQSLGVIKEAQLDTSIINVNGGAVALGHPLGASGTYLFMKLIEEQKARNVKYGMVTACIGGGQGIAGIFENL
ncbi:MAG: acetyl-CoA C-acyltransferase [Chitinophagales bacterium]|nr:acetyl-CoA C-acyltransferase [Chitinophagales bacterium]MCO5281322.1 acetyl-CoA C-acyltransferase [Chitinophagales bacterium]OJV29924.1 MAG: acetyl-CoA acetyltransferase [Bacteroidetes bacterium 37-13]HRN95518.1 acetyl-CoA C-acyltransferase [Chitinophagales bacterium]HRP39077.1 acetyl-CoA C-acyltransferase [Chitinophagales bacterium]